MATDSYHTVEGWDQALEAASSYSSRPQLRAVFDLGNDRYGVAELASDLNGRAIKRLARDGFDAASAEGTPDSLRLVTATHERDNSSLLFGFDA